MTESPDPDRYAIYAVTALAVGMTICFWIGWAIVHDRTGLTADAVFTGACTVIAGAGAIVGIAYQVRKASESSRIERLAERQEFARGRLVSTYLLARDMSVWAARTANMAAFAIEREQQSGSLNWTVDPFPECYDLAAAVIDVLPFREPRLDKALADVFHAHRATIRAVEALSSLRDLSAMTTLSVELRSFRLKLGVLTAFFNKYVFSVEPAEAEYSSG